MGTNSLRNTLAFIFIVLIFLLITSKKLSAQFVQADHPVYPFLSSLYFAGMIPDFDLSQRPISKRTLLAYLRQIEEMKSKISDLDVQTAQRFIEEFTFGTLRTEQKVPFVYKNVIDSLLTVMIWGKMNVGFYSVQNTEYSATMEPYFFSDYTYSDEVGIRFKFSNGKVFGKKSSALQFPEFYSNFKLNESAEESFFDNTDGSLLYEGKYLSAAIGRERLYRGFEGKELVIGAIAPVQDFVSFGVHTRTVNYDFLHSRLLGSESVSISPEFGPVRTVTEKHLAMHRMSFLVWDNIRFSAGEAIIYSRRGIDLSYLNPVSFFKSVEHSNRDRDNALLFFDITAPTGGGFTLLGNLVVDDLDFSTLGQGWIANKFAWSARVVYSERKKFFPFSVTGGILGIDPYTYTHRIPENSFTHFSLPVATEQPPNSINFHAGSELSLMYGLNVSVNYEYILHGDNEYSETGVLLKNHGGRIQQGWRETDSKYNKLLSGIKKHYRRVTASAIFDPDGAFSVTGLFRYGFANFMDFENDVLQVYCVIGFNF